ncbi:MAG: anhydro-N-acetylmuramic acid kinase [Planctomycetes bacterium]|nr:anhydro-N-acetylmuramic acid kinase [Planctomycetota bacterium]
MTKKGRRAAGLMSGTSCDGIDACIVDIRGRRVDVLAFETFPYPHAASKRIFDLFERETSSSRSVCHMNFVLGDLFADALIDLARKRHIPLSSIDVIGSHGQTIYHVAKPRKTGGRAYLSTLQIGEPSIIAQKTGVTTVADFRPRDIAAGGTGAPLVPYADYVLFRDRTKTRAVQNIGGIANVTFLPAGGGVEDVIAFDTGPGNMILDRVAVLATRGKLKCDLGGKLAAKGMVHEKALASLMQDSFFRQRPPKSTGREKFGVQFTDALFRRFRMPFPDLAATVTMFTAKSIAVAYKKFLNPIRGIDEVILCGGGAHNPTLVGMIRDRLDPVPVRIIDEYGINADAKEAVSFAILANATLNGIPNNVPGATGAKERVVLGKIIPGAK